MVGNQLTTDILFGNLNRMATVWVNSLKDESLKEKSEELFKLENEKIDLVNKEESTIDHKGLKKNL